MAFVLPANEAACAVEDPERLYGLIAETIPVMVWTANAAGEVDFVNQRVAEYTGLDSAALSSWALLVIWLTLPAAEATLMPAVAAMPAVAVPLSATSAGSADNPFAAWAADARMAANANTNRTNMTLT